MLTIRPAIAGDVPSLLTLIRELAEFERLPVSTTERILLRDGFGANPRFRALLAEWSGELAGYAFFFPFYSTFEGPGMLLEDVYVREKFRGKRIGLALIQQAAAIAGEQDCFSLRWQVLHWNQRAIDFYQQLGAEFLDEWRTVQLQGDALQKIAGGASHGSPRLAGVARAGNDEADAG